jgi:hypothetical protein
MRWWLDYLAAFQTLVLNGNVADCKAIFQARRAFKQWRHEFDADREAIQRNRVKTTIPEQSNISVLWQYYARGKKTFKQVSQNQK